MTDQRILRIIIDDRENKVKKCMLENQPTSLFTIKRLLIGDFVVTFDSISIIVERKTLKDLSASIKDKRIYKQIDKLKSQRESFCFIIEGDFTEYIIAEKKKYNHLLPVKCLQTRLTHMKEDNINIFYTKDIYDTINHLEFYIPMHYKAMQP